MKEKIANIIMKNLHDLLFDSVLINNTPSDILNDAFILGKISNYEEEVCTGT